VRRSLLLVAVGRWFVDPLSSRQVALSEIHIIGQPIA